MVYTLVLLRHGESEWNRLNLFCGWVDSPLSQKGRLEAQEAGELLAENGFVFDLAFTSELKRAQQTLRLVEKKLGRILAEKSWRLNERHYGGLQGLNKAETAVKYGEAQVKTWRRSFDARPPALLKEGARFDEQKKRFPQIPEGQQPLCESLKDAVARTLPYWEERIAPEILRGKRVLVVGHGNSLRGLVKHLDELSDEAVVELNIPTGIPMVYELDGELKPLRHYYLGGEEKAREAAARVAAQAEAK